ncbi:MAG TPA: CopD family protein [Gammaproteobacteria bacterium]|nr:CopD family protein [Gammaproteobacteria bacterium]
MSVPAWQEALSGFDILAISAAVGGIAALLWLLPGTDTPATWRTDIRRHLRLFLAATLALLTLTSVAVLIARSIAISGRPLLDVGDVVPLVLMQTDFGHIWFVRGGAVVLLWIAWAASKPARRQSLLYWLLLALVAAVAYTRSATGHAGDHGDLQIPVWVDWLHLLAAGLWGGVVIAFVVAVRPVLRQQQSQAGRAEVAERFSSVAAAGLGLVVATGIYNAWHTLGGWRPLWTTRYGVILDIKVGLVIAMALLGATNRFRHVPAVLKAGRGTAAPLKRAGAFRSLAATAAAETLLMLAILAVVALLVNGMPPADMP